MQKEMIAAANVIRSGEMQIKDCRLPLYCMTAEARRFEDNKKAPQALARPTGAEKNLRLILARMDDECNENSCHY